MSDGTLVPLGAVKRAIARLEDKHPEFWDYLDEELERAYETTPPVGKLLHGGFMLREEMDRRGLSYRDLEALTTYNHAYLSRLARGLRSPSPVAAMTIAKALKVKPEDLFPLVESGAGPIEGARQTLTPPSPSSIGDGPLGQEASKAEGRTTDQAASDGR